MPVASDIEEPTKDADAAGEGLPINEAFLLVAGRGNACWRAFRVCKDVWV